MVPELAVVNVYMYMFEITHQIHGVITFNLI